MNENEERTIQSEMIYRGRILNLRRDTVALPNGRTAPREVVEHNGGIGVAALTPAGELLMVRQLRYPYGESLLEIPAGKREGNEEPLRGGQRELREETGAVGRDYRYLGRIYPTPGYCSEVIWLYLCRVASVGEMHLDPDEFICVERVPLADAVQLVMAGKIPDAKTQIAVLKTAELVRTGVYPIAVPEKE